MVRKRSGKNLWLAALLSGLLAPLQAAEWHMPTPYPAGEHHTRNIVEFAEAVRETTGGELRITVHPAASLYGHDEIHRAVRGGQVAIGEMLMGRLGNDLPLFKVDNIPFLVADFEDAEKLWRISRPALEKALDRQGLMLLFAVPWPPQGLYTTTAVNSPADLAGRKLRAYSPLTARLAVLLDASPVTVQVPEIPQAFSTGIIDAMFTSPSTGVSSQAWDYVDHYTDTRAWIPKNMVIVNTRAFRRLSREAQAGLLDAARRAETRGWQMAREETRSDTALLAKHGIRIAEPTPALLAALRETGNALSREWIDETGNEGARIIEQMRQ